MKKVIFICYLPLTYKLEKDFYIQELIEGKLHVEYWDVTSIFFEDLSLEGIISRDYIKKIDSYKRLRGKIKAENIKDCIFHVQVVFEERVYKLFSILSKYNCRVTFFSRGHLASPSDNYCEASPVSKNPETKVYTKILKYLKNPIKIYHYISFKIGGLMVGLKKKYIYSICRYHTVFCAGQVAVEAHKGAAKTISINYFDYDDYLSVRTEDTKVIEGKYCVFLDDYLPFHPDFKMLNKKTLEPGKYFKALNSFFDFLEDKYELEVVIAAHPKSNYSKDRFRSRKVVKYLTNELVKNCDFAIAHATTSISFPILYKKSIVFIYTNEYKELYLEDHMQLLFHWTSLLNASLYNIDSLSGLEFRIPNVNFDKYEAYKYNYLTSAETEHKFTKDILLSYFKEEL